MGEVTGSIPVSSTILFKINNLAEVLLGDTT